MELPSKHHFNPAFSLKPWAGKDGNVCQMRKIGPNVHARRAHPNATGFMKDLYRIDGVDDEQSQHLEVSFFKPLDTDAEKALQKILSGDRSEWDGPQRSAWTRYILSLIYRVPTRVAVLKEHIAEMWKEGVQALEAHYLNRRLPTDPATFAEYFAQTNSAAPQISAANLLMQIIDNENIGPVIFNMHWSRISLPRANVELLYSDRPIDRPLGLGDPRAYIALPIAPRTLFLAAHSDQLVEHMSQLNQTKTVKQLNKTSVTQAREFVWGSNESQLVFVRKYLGTAPERDLISVEQREQAIRAARGQENARGKPDDGRGLD